MGFRFRQSKDFGPFRLNFSKSGVGFSYGVKGFRVSKMSNGRTRVTTSIPGTGISHVTETSSGKRRKTDYRNTVRGQMQRAEIMDGYGLSERQMRKLEADAMKHPKKFQRLAKKPDAMDSYIKRKYGSGRRTFLLILLALFVIIIILGKK